MLNMSTSNEMQQNDFFAEAPATDEVESTSQTPYQCLMQEPTASLALDATIDPQCTHVAILGYN
jgi:hypothetical protein